MFIFLPDTYDRLHSGSRNAGKSTAEYYDLIAQQHMKDLGVKDTKGLAYLDIDSDVGRNYLTDMTWNQVKTN